MTRVEDESGQGFWVDKGDPAQTLLQKLHSRHYSWIVLPRALLLGYPSTFRWCDTLRRARSLGYNGEGRRLLRMAECLKEITDAKR